MTGAVAADMGRKWAIGAMAFLLGFLALATLVIGDGLSGLDQLVRGLVHRPGPPLFHSSMEAASFWGGHTGQAGVILVASVAFWQRRRWWALSLPIVMAGAGMLQLVAKWAVARPRPNLDPWGFPSAHVLSLVVLLGCLAYIVATSDMRRGWRRLGVSTCGALVCTVAYSRMYLDAHWLSDVLGGLTIGVAYLLGVIWLHSRTARPA
jgi:membrane-associated phospholipid phosphatase